MREITFIPSGQGETMNASRGRHHSVLTQGIGAAVQEAGIFAKQAASMDKTCEMRSNCAAQISIWFVFTDPVEA